MGDLKRAADGTLRWVWPDGSEWIQFSDMWIRIASNGEQVIDTIDFGAETDEPS